jgi:hypothetical protein
VGNRRAERCTGSATRPLLPPGRDKALLQPGEAKGAEILTGEYLKTLFQLGFRKVLGRKFRAARLKDPSYATGKTLSGLKSARPRNYRGLDSYGIDGCREFREMQDVKKMSDIIEEL